MLQWIASTWTSFIQTPGHRALKSEMYKAKVSLKKDDAIITYKNFLLQGEGYEKIHIYKFS